MECGYHKRREAVAVCVTCKKPVCEDCKFELNGKAYCRKCATAIIEETDEKLKLEIPDEVTCSLCGRVRYAGETYYLCSNCGEVVCPRHWYEEEGLCEGCYDQSWEDEVNRLKRTGLTRPCPNCGTDNLLESEYCIDRSCGAALPPLKNAEDIRKRNVPCYQHPDNPAFVECVDCGKYLCLECENSYKNENYCDGCLAENKRQEALRRKKKTKTALIAGAITFGIIIIFVLTRVIAGTISNRYKYEEANAYYEAGEYEKAIERFYDLGEFKDSDERLKEVKNAAYERELNKGNKGEEAGDFDKALTHYEAAGKYGDSKKDIVRVTLLLGQQSLENKNFKEAVKYYNEAKGIRPLSDEDLRNYDLALTYLQIEKGDKTLKEADDTLRGFSYKKAINNDDEYLKLFKAASETDKAVNFYEKAEKINPGLKPLKRKLKVAREKKRSRQDKLSRLDRDRLLSKNKEAEVRLAAERLDFAQELRRSHGSVSVSGPANKYIRIYDDVFNKHEAEVIASPPQLFLNDLRAQGFEKVTMVGPDYSRTYYLK